MRLSLIAIIAAAGVAAHTPALAQDADASEDEVISYGTKQQDPAMSAWNAGDYATAEVEFERNAFCALRVERGFQAGVENARISADRGIAFEDAQAAPNPSGGPGGGAAAPIADGGNVGPGLNVNAQGVAKRENPNKRTCENRGFQVYMKGMSQLKLGKVEEAKDAFYQATNLNRQLYDAHFRLSLMEYQAGNLDKANKEANALRRLQSRCRACDAKEEIAAQIGYLDQLLGAQG